MMRSWQSYFRQANWAPLPPFGELFSLPVFFDQSMVVEKVIAFKAGAHRDLIQMNLEDLLPLVQPEFGAFAVHGIERQPRSLSPVRGRQRSIAHAFQVGGAAYRPEGTKRTASFHPGPHSELNRSLTIRWRDTCQLTGSRSVLDR
jgi:hypothetical protein